MMNTQTMYGLGQTQSAVSSAFLVLAGTIATFTVGGVLNAATDGYFHGRARKKGVTYKTIAKRNAVLGGAVGALVAATIIANPSVVNN